ncbi:MAG: hypothetical protein ACUVRR_09615 [Candidatus Fervidibacter sp.]|uniref:hypothetical protein n=1 Tax=Candidatus Fervidibacter sp. TaxID=3100871 RepID=UPI0040499C5A
MKKLVACLTIVVFSSFVFAQSQPVSERQTATQPQPPTKSAIFIPSGSTLLTELHLTKDDLLPVIEQVFSYFSLQHSGGQVIQGEQLRGLIASMEALWLVEYEFRQKGAVPADLVQMNQSLLEAQGWRRVFWNRSSDGKRETMVMVEPPRKGLFVFMARLNQNSGATRVIAIRTQGEVDVGMTLWLLTTFLMKPEAPASTPSSSPSAVEKSPSVKPTPEKGTEKQAEPEKPPEQDKERSGDGGKGKETGELDGGKTQVNPNKD